MYRRPRKRPQNARNAPQNGRQRKSGRQVSYRKTITVTARLLWLIAADPKLASILHHGGPELCRVVSEIELEAALPEKQRKSPA